MAEINKIEIDGVEYTITAPREVVKCVEGEAFDIVVGEDEKIINFKNGYDNKYLEVNATDFYSGGENIIINFPKYKNTKVFIYLELEDAGNLLINTFQFYFSSYLNYLGNSVNFFDVDGYLTSYDESFLRLSSQKDNTAFIIEFDEIGIANLSVFNLGHEI